MSYEEIILQLKAEEASLVQQLERIKVAIAALSETEESFSANFPKHFKKGNSKAAIIGGLYQPVPVPEHYDPKSKLKFRIAFLLNKYGKLTAKELIEKVLENEPNADKEKVIRDVTYQASSLGRKNNLKTTRIGKQFLYSL